MTYHFQSSTTHEAVQLLAEHGFEAMAQAIQVLMNEAMRIERAHYLQAAPTSDPRADDPMPTASSQKPSSAAWGSYNSKSRKHAIPSSILRRLNALNGANEPSNWPLRRCTSRAFPQEK